MTCSELPHWWTFNVGVWSELVTALGDINVAQIKNIKSWRKLNVGLSNASFCLTLRTTQYFIQVVNPQKKLYKPNPDYHQLNHRLLNSLGLTSWLVDCIYESPSLRIFAWWDAPVTTLDCFNNRSNFELMVCFLAELHQLTPSINTINMPQYLQNYYQLALINSPHRQVELAGYLSRGIQLAESFEPRVLCHNDLTPENLMFTAASGKELKVVDWEYAAIGDPIFDLAGLSHNFQFNEEAEKWLIQKYSEKLEIKIQPEKFNKMKELYRLVGALWAE